jgi:galactose mutarotase-like enzyme
MRVSLPAVLPQTSPPDIQQPLDGSADRITTADGEFKFLRVLLSEGASAGVELLIVETDRVRVAICPTRGMSLWRACIDGLSCGWRSPVEGPIHPSFVPVQAPDGIGWLEGFDELLVRCGLRSFGAPDFDEAGRLLFPLHGRIANLPARNLSLEVDEERALLRVSGSVHETRTLLWNLELRVTYEFSLGDARINVYDRVTNRAATPTTAQMLYHVNVAEPFLNEGAKLHVQADRAVARDARAAEDLSTWSDYLGPTAEYAEQVYFFKGLSDSDGWSHVLLQSASEDVGFGLQYKTDTLPYLTQWKNTVARRDGYVTGIEPGTGFPNTRSFEEEHKRLVELASGESIDFELKLDVYSNAARMEPVIEAITKSAGSVDTADFDADWCVSRS